MTSRPTKLERAAPRLNCAAAILIAVGGVVIAQAAPLEPTSDNSGMALEQIKTAVFAAAVRDGEPLDFDIASQVEIGSSSLIERSRQWVEHMLRLPRSSTPTSISSDSHDQPGASSDPRWEHANHSLEEGRPFTAALELKRLSSLLWTDGASPPTDWTALFARCLLAYGIQDSAKHALEALPKSSEVNVNRNRAWLDLADYEFHRGEADTALASLDVLPAKLEGKIEYDAYLLRALILMSQHQDESAVYFLKKIQPAPRLLLSAPAAEVNKALLPQYNLGVALLRAGQTEQGRSVLNRIGNFEARNHELLTLRDKANLILGWQFLREDQGATARPIFERISQDGPFSNRALLGLGWAALAEAGAVQTRNDIAVAPYSLRETPTSLLKAMQRRHVINCEDFNRLAQAPQEFCKPGASFEQRGAHDDSVKHAEAALAPWIELQGRDAEDPAVREAWAALPRAFLQLGALAEARRSYESALPKLEAELAATVSIKARLDDQSLVIPESLITNRTREPAMSVPAASIVAFLRLNGLDNLSGDLELAEPLSVLLDVMWLQQRISSKAHVTEEIGKSLDDLRVDSERKLKDAAIRQLEARSAVLNGYLKAVRSGLAGIYDAAQ